MAIRAALIFNNHGKPRLTRFYSQLPTSRQQALIRRTFALVHRRTTQRITSTGREVCNFLDAPELRPLLPPPASHNGNHSEHERIDISAAQYYPYDPYDEVAGSSSSKRGEASSSKAKAKAANRKTTSRHERNGNIQKSDDQLRVIYRHYATLYFVFIVDESESELGILDLIQVFVESLDRSFENVCELDLIFHFEEVHAILDEIIQGGLVLETNIHEIAAASQASARARKASAAQGTLSGAAAGLGGAAKGSNSALGWTPIAALGAVPWGDATAGVGDWAREWGSRLGGGGRSAGSLKSGGFGR